MVETIRRGHQVALSDALSRSFLGSLEPAMVNAVASRAAGLSFGRGEAVVSENELHWTGLMICGAARVFLYTPDGRQVTLRHAGIGSTIGLAALLSDATVSAEALTACDVLQFDTDHLIRMANRSPSLAMAIVAEIGSVVMWDYAGIAFRMDAGVRQRLARYLLESTMASEQSARLIVLASHEQLADAIGSVREVVSRHLARFEAEALVSLDRGRIRLVDAEKLDQAARRI